MFSLTVKKWREPAPYLGIGTYYVRPDTNAISGTHDWISVRLKSPLILQDRQVRMLMQKYGTDSEDKITAMAGAWTLRREILLMGHDGIIALGSTMNDGCMTIVELVPTGAPSHRVTAATQTHHGAEICRLPVGEPFHPR
jgi:hypothetical protein